MDLSCINDKIAQTIANKCNYKLCLNVLGFFKFVQFCCLYHSYLKYSEDLLSLCPPVCLFQHSHETLSYMFLANIS